MFARMVCRHHVARSTSSRCHHLLKFVAKHAAQPPTRSVSSRLLAAAAQVRHATSHDQLRHASATAFTAQQQHETIYALSSGQGRAGIAVIRISGPACLSVVKALCPGKALPKPRQATVRTLYEPGSTASDTQATILDSTAIVLHFPAPKTATGEDLVELHIHGGPATIKAVLAAIPRSPIIATSSSSIVRYAEPGEFTKRAFLNDRLDLAQVESLGDILFAETEQQRRAAVRGTAGARSAAYDTWRHELVQARGEIEAIIDFEDDTDLDATPTELLGNVTAAVKHILAAVEKHEIAGQKSELLRDGIRIALLGPPNVGKSSLMNVIVGREASIVSREAGTTRDIVEVSLDLRGYLCLFADTAGFRTEKSASSGDVGLVEREGIRRARKKAIDSDIIVVMVSVEQDPSGEFFLMYDEETLELASKAQQGIIVINKCDQVSMQQLDALVNDFKKYAIAEYVKLRRFEPLRISCEAQCPIENVGDGVQGLVQGLVQSFSDLTLLPEDMQELLGGTQRQRQLLAECRNELMKFMKKAKGIDGEDPDVVLAAEHLRLAAITLSRITGRGDAGDVEEVLGVIFEKFCVGK